MPPGVCGGLVKYLDVVRLPHVTYTLVPNGKTLPRRAPPLIPFN